MQHLLSIAFLAALAIPSSIYAQDVRELLTLNREAALSTNKGASETLDLTFTEVGHGLRGTAHETIDLGNGRYVENSVSGPVKNRSGFDGSRAWVVDLSNFAAVQNRGSMMRLGVNRAYRNANLWWRFDYGGAAITGVGSDRIDGRVCDRLRVTPKDGSPFEACFDHVSHLLDRVIERRPFSTATITYTNYRLVDGLQIAGTRVIDEGSGPSYAKTQTLAHARISFPEASTVYDPPQPPADTTIDGPTGSTSIPFRLIGDHIYGQVMVNGKGPYTFLFDTGGANILSPSTAQALGVDVQGEAPANGTGKAVVKLGYANGVNFKLGGLELKDQTVSVLPLGGQKSVGFEVQGVIGYELYHRVVTRFDYGARTITFTTPAKFDPNRAGTSVPFTLYDTVPLVEGNLEGIPARFIIDTGDGGELDVTTPFVAEHDLIKSHPRGVGTRSLGGIGGSTGFYVTRASSLDLGTVHVPNLVMRLSNQQAGNFADPGYSGDVGSGLLKRFSVTFDHSRNKLFLKALIKPITDTASYDKSGLGLENGSGGFVVSSVIANSPAASVGIKSGDIIVAVDKQLVAPTSLPDFLYKLRNASSGTIVSLRVRTGISERNVTLVLKKLI